mmetsp:Transcript_12239/g.18324  ORF Transcript_12239/g.18324 Transcript_12239/m.18324 type:complete len:440 (+) Transcript_12239:331-1650(+)
MSVLDQIAVLDERNEICSGHLLKLGANVKKFKKRYCVIKPMTLMIYYFNEGDVEPRGCIDLEKFSEVVPHGDHPCNSFELKGSDCEQSFVFEAETDQKCRHWIESIRKSRFGVLKNEADQLLNKCERLESELRRVRDDMKMMSHYANLRHQSALALKEERETKKEIQEKILALERELSADSKNLETDQTEIFDSLESVASSVRELKEANRKLEEEAKEMKNEAKKSENVIQELRRELERANKALKAQIELYESDMREADKRLNLHKLSALKQSSESDEIILSLKSKLQEAKAHKRVLINELKSARAACEQENESGSVSSQQFEDSPKLSKVSAPTEKIRADFEEYELNFAHEKIGLQLKLALVPNNGPERIFVDGRVGYNKPLSERPKIGSQLVSYNGKSLQGEKYEEVVKILKEAGRPITLGFREYRGAQVGKNSSNF